MAPTICSEKKPRQIRTNLKEIRRQPNTTSALLSSVAVASASVAAGMGGSGGAATNNSNGNAPIATSIINYAGSARNSAPLRVRGRLNTGAAEKSFLEPLRINRLQLLERDQQISDNVVSSSTPTGLKLMRAITAEQMDLDDDITDEEDCEVHSITSGAQCYNRHNNNNTSSHNIKTVFTAPTLHDKQSLPPKTATTTTTTTTFANNQHSQKHYQQQYYAASDDDEHDSSICEIKNTEGLLAIALKTIKLVKRNQMLQRRLAQLQLETSEFIQSVLANPENRHFRNKMQKPSSPSVTSATSPSVTPLQALQSPTATTADN
ncbi:PREDICTED: uncharacterized protein LOC108361920 [Rhagoletis zephyria]|uniref:uncharacterized protein LOC108361920 n=1 Tax=Rhagoletis zephyria TaxID=28612 RepID=UPI00081167AE|nr:PREDICTED: uncharacterized protein LOC108361920 [Rhagoletis zephyria]